jgi:gentisate 1,2-dioxygenase
MSTSALDAKPQASAEREEFYQRLAKKNAAPLWEVLAEVVPPQPRTRFAPAIWKYDELRPLLMESGGLITAQEAERRVLILENPGSPGASQITGTLYAGLQLVLPGEIAPSHRHAASALRFVIESDGGYTAVDGEKLIMHPGDFIVTPSWEYHDHGNNTSAPVIWLDVLDLPLVNLMGCSFAEHHPHETQAVTKKVGDSMARYGANLFPVNYTRKGLHSPLLNYTYEHSREALFHYSKHVEADPCHGVKMQYINPATGESAMRAIATFLQLLPKGFSGKPYRSTDATVFTAIEGKGQTTIGSTTFTWGPRDIFVAPSWLPVTHQASEEAVLFSASDRPIQKMLGLWREQAPST